jgi:hypothetical protein
MKEDPRAQPVILVRLLYKKEGVLGAWLLSCVIPPSLSDLGWFWGSEFVSTGLIQTPAGIHNTHGIYPSA